ncbi:MAG: DEAD/DEAH box helicase [Candidatus Binatia bacterium]
MSFSELGLHPSLLRCIDSRGYTTPTTIQKDAIVPALAGRDVLGAAATGSGKTAAFLLPILHHLLENPRRGTRALILAPTRELASQIMDEAQIFSRGTNIRAAVVVGGVGMRPQEQALRAGTDIIVATPGRLLDHLRSSYARLDGVEHLVLDEADRMLDMGFLPDVRRILSRVPNGRQTLFFSATVPPEISRLAGEMLKNPARIGAERKAAPASSVTQHVYPVASTRKSSLLVALLEQNVVGGALAFTRTKHRADRLAHFLCQSGIRADRIHGNRSMNQRTAALADFKSGKLRVLVATDIAARGIDVTALGHVVNFDLPGRPEDYIHRVGRTGRASETGDAFTFVSPEDESDMRHIERALGGGPIVRRKLEGFDYTAAAQPPSVESRRAAPRQVMPRRGGGASPSRSYSGGRTARRA